jgi:hypothetical protein
MLQAALAVSVNQDIANTVTPPPQKKKQGQGGFVFGLWHNAVAQGEKKSYLDTSFLVTLLVTQVQAQYRYT